MRHIPGHIKVVLFDHDDTLVGTIGPKWAEHKYIAKTYYHKDLTDDEIRLHWGRPLEELVGILYGTEDIKQAIDHNVAHHTEFEKELFHATLPMLKRLKVQGYKIGIITATSRFSFSHDLSHHKVPTEILDYTQAADDTNFHKPDPRVFKPALAWLKSQSIEPNEVVYVGDGLHDMKAATGAGFTFLGVETGLVTAEEFAKNGIMSVPDVSHILAD